MVNVDAVIRNCVEDIWGEYDIDGSGALDKEECRNFVIQTMREFAGDEAVKNFSHPDFEFTFKLFDVDRNGTIEKSEMVRFIRKTAGLSVGKLPRPIESDSDHEEEKQ